MVSSFSCHAVEFSVDAFSCRLTAGDQEPCASTLSSHLVHPLIIKAGNKWSSDTEVNPLADGHLEGEDDEVNSDGMALTQPIGPRGEDIGLRCLRVQGKSFAACRPRSMLI